MKNNNLVFKNIILIAVLGLFVGCSDFSRYEEVEISTVGAGKLCLYGGIEADQPGLDFIALTRTGSVNQSIKWDFNVGATISIDTFNGRVFRDINRGQILFDTAIGASVELFRNDTLIQTLIKSNRVPQGWFSTVPSLSPFVPNAVYKLVATAPGFKTIEAEQKAPRLLRPLNVVLTNNFYNGVNNNLYREVLITLPDVKGERNAYQVSFAKYDTTFRRFDAPAFKIDPNAVDAYIIDDTNFDGQNYIWRTGVLADPSDGKLLRYLDVSVSNISIDYVNFLRNNILQANAAGNPFTEPFSTYSNVKNGYGVFFLYTSAQSYNLDLR